MSLTNITFAGNIYNASGSQYVGSEVRYQLYFHKVSGESSPSTWSSTRLSEYGQYNINLGDGDILTPDGSSNTGDAVIIAFWTPTTSLKTDGDLEEWGFIETTLTSGSYYISDVQLKGPIVPTCDFTVTNSSFINEDVVATDVGSHNKHSWVYGSTTVYQEPSRYNQPIFYVMNTLQPSSYSISWDDGTFDNNLNPASTYTHQYTSPGNYNITTYVTNISGLSASQLFLWSVYYSTPVIGFSMDVSSPNPVGTDGVGELVTFTNTTTDPDGQAGIDGWTCDWLIEDGSDSVTYMGQDFNFSPTHQFHSSGTHDVTLVVHWYSGSAWTTSTTTHQVTQGEWSVSNGLVWSTPVYVDAITSFTPSISGDTSYVTSVDYVIDGVEPLTSYDINEGFDYSFSFSDTHTVQQIIHYNTGFENVVKVQVYNITMSPMADFVQADDTCGNKYTSDSEPGKQPITMYKWKVYQGSTELASLEGSLTNVFRYNWPYAPTTYKIWHQITDGAGQTAEIIKTYPVSACSYGTTVVGTGGSGYGGGKTTVVREVEKPLPKVRVKIKKEKEPQINVWVKLIR